MANFSTPRQGRANSMKIRRSGASGNRNPTAIAGLLFAVASALSCGGKSNESVSGGPQTNTHLGGAGLGASPSTEAGAPQVHTTVSVGGTTSTIAATAGGTTSTMATTAGGTTVDVASGGTPAATGGSTTTNTVSASGGVEAGGAASGIGGLVTSGTNIAGTAGAGAGTSTSGGATSTTNRVAQLRTQPSWADLKRLWKSLDAVTPKNTTYVPYASTISDEQRDQWIAELGATLVALGATGVLSDIEILFLRQAATARIEVMRDGGYHYEMYLHRAPFLFEDATENSVGRLEQKLDVLESLRSSCQIEPDAYRQALEQVEREAAVFFVMDQLMLEQSSDYRNLTLPTDLWGAELVAELDRRLAAVAADPATSTVQQADIAELRARLETIGATVTELPVLVKELERCE